MEQRIFYLIHNIAGRSRFLDLLGIFLADYLGYALLIFFLIIFFSRKGLMLEMGGRWQERFYQFFLVALAVLISRFFVVEIVRFFYPRPRPYVTLVFQPLIEPNFTSAFPSGHASLYFALATAIFLLNRRWGYWFLAGAVLIALGRVYVGVHWPADVLVGAGVGVASAWLTKRFLPKPVSFS